MNFFRHLHLISRHHRLVRKYCFKCHLYRQGLFHDASKLSPVEFFNGVRYFAGHHSPTTNERSIKGYSDAWLHHKGRNRHHPEYWVDYSPVEKRYMPVIMPRKYVVESFCDRISASQIYNKENYHRNFPYEYLIGEKSFLPIHPQTYQELLGLLKYYAEHTDKETFKYIREVYLKGK